MRKKIISSLLLGLFLYTASCTTIKYTNEGQEVADSKRVVYLLNGLVPLNNNNIKSGPEYIEKYTFLDYVFSGLTLGIIHTRTVEKK